MTFEDVQREYDVTGDDIRAALKFLGAVVGVETAKRALNWTAFTGDGFVLPLVIAIVIGRCREEAGAPFAGGIIDSRMRTLPATASNLHRSHIIKPIVRNRKN
jgi:hypothetical protein